MKLIQLYRHIMIGLKIRKPNGLITYGSLYMMFFITTVSIAVLQLSALSLSNTIDEMNLMKAHYDAERGARWFVAYGKSGGTFDDKQPIIVEADSNHTVYIKADATMSVPRHVMSYGIRNGYTARVHLYLKEGNNHTFEVVSIKPY